MVVGENALYKPVEIIGWGKAVPEGRRTNADILTMYPGAFEGEEAILRRCGIKERRVAAANEFTSDLAARAGLAALRVANLPPEEVQLILVARTMAEDEALPTAALVQPKIEGCRAPAFDIDDACTGSVTGLQCAASYITADEVDNVLLIFVETPTRWTEDASPETVILFGDGASAVVLRRSVEKKLLAFATGTDGTRAHYISRPYGSRTLHFEGPHVFKRAVVEMATYAEKVLQKSGRTLDEIALFLFHQANFHIIRAAARRLGLVDGKGNLDKRVFVNIEKYGNTSAASVFIAFCEAMEQGRIKRGDLIAIASFGAGLGFGAAIFEF